MPSAYALVLAGLILAKLTEYPEISWWLIFGVAISPVALAVIAVLAIAAWSR